MIRLARNQDRQQQMSLRTASFLAGLWPVLFLYWTGPRELGLEGLFAKRCGPLYEAGKFWSCWGHPKQKGIGKTEGGGSGYRRGHCGNLGRRRDLKQFQKDGLKGDYRFGPTVTG